LSGRMSEGKMSYTAWATPSLSLQNAEADGQFDDAASAADRHYKLEFLQAGDRLNDVHSKVRGVHL